VNNLTSPNFATVSSSTAGSTGTFDKYQETYAFTDSLDMQKIQVTEQLQKKKYSTIQDEVNSVASSSNATSSFTTLNGYAFLKTYPNSSIQIVFAPVDGLLITVVSSTSHSLSSWTSYINSLHKAL
jgi:hypothetical protein